VVKRGVLAVTFGAAKDTPQFLSLFCGGSLLGMALRVEECGLVLLKG
jgi:hypothetical protein